jgi:hypothetical protein
MGASRDVGNGEPKARPWNTRDGDGNWGGRNHCQPADKIISSLFQERDETVCASSTQGAHCAGDVIKGERPSSFQVRPIGALLPSGRYHDRQTVVLATVRCPATLNAEIKTRLSVEVRKSCNEAECCPSRKVPPPAATSKLRGSDVSMNAGGGLQISSAIREPATRDYAL